MLDPHCWVLGRVQRNASFSKFWRKSRNQKPPMSAKLRPLQPRILKFEHFFFFSKTCEFQKTQDSGHAATQIACVPESAKIHIPPRILKFEHFYFFQKLANFKKNTRQRPCSDPNCLRPRGGKNPDTATNFENWKKLNFQKKVQISENLMVRGRSDPNRLRPGGGPIPAGPEICEFFLHIFAPNLPSVGSSLPSLADSTTLARRIVWG